MQAEQRFVTQRFSRVTDGDRVCRPGKGPPRFRTAVRHHQAGVAQRSE
jgi:hypothetical protein